MMKEIQENEESIDTSSTQELGQEGVQAMQGESDGTSDWQDHGIIDVPVADLPTPENVSSPDDFDHHISWDDAAQRTHELPQLQEEVNGGKTGEDYSKEDEIAGLDYENGSRKLYDLYYGDDPVVLNKVGSDYDITSGRHRIFAAQHEGIDSIPARVKEKMADNA